jgi:murein DD-endopeptidase MepM/ murein hydrolase activator NlpD
VEDASADVTGQPSTNEPADRRAHARWLLTGFLVPVLGGIAVYWALHLQARSVAIGIDAADLTEQFPSVHRIEQLSEPIVKPIGDAVDFIVKRNDTLEQIFRRMRLSLEDLAAIRSLPGVRENLDTIRPGETIAVIHVDGALQSLVRRISETTTLAVTRESSGFNAQVVETPLDVRTVSVQGVIESSLFVSGRAAGMSSDLIMRLANDIFGWDIDFALEIQPNDRFAVLYEQRFRDGAYVSDGRILAAEFINAGREYRAIRFESADGKVADYFTPTGKSMRKQFLRAPVDFKYISSNFNPRRLHPILNVRRAHQGVDYAAPTGTPIKASGDGRISFVGTKGGYGQSIILEHGGAVSTLYAHMSRFAKNMRPGARVKQGDVIGYVGSTGTATAAHLHYEYRVNGVHKNPRTVSLPDANPIPGEYLTEFQTASGGLLAQLDQSRASQVALVPTN